MTKERIIIIDDDCKRLTSAAGGAGCARVVDVIIFGCFAREQMGTRIGRVQEFSIRRNAGDAVGVNATRRYFLPTAVGAIERRESSTE